MESNELNALSLNKALPWLLKVIEARFKDYFKPENAVPSVSEIKAPDLSEDISVFATSIKNFGFSSDERLIIILALAPHVRPSALDIFFTKNSDYDRGFSEFGGIKGENFGGFIPTGQRTG